MSKNYPELTLELTRREQQTYRLKLRFQSPDSQGEVDPAAGQDLTIEIDLGTLQTLENDPAAYGKQLGAYLFKPEVVQQAFTLAQAAADTAGQPLRVRLETAPDASELQSLHWEALYGPDGATPLFQGEKLLFSRFLSSAEWGAIRLRPKHGLKALVVAANPSDLDVYSLQNVKVDEEFRRAREALTGIQVDTLGGNGEHVTLNAILKRLHDGEYDILYIVAHGATRKDESYLWLENEKGETDRVSGQVLKDEFKKLARQPLLVALLACETAGSAASPALSAIGPQLAEAGVPAVLAMQGKFSVDSGKMFMPAFFQSLAEEGVLDQAAAIARNTVRSQPDYWMPVLFTRLKDCEVYGAPGVEDRVTEQVGGLRRNLIWIAAVIGLLVLGVAGLVFWQSARTQAALRATPTPSTMTKDFNVAIAQFSVVDDQGVPLKSPDGVNLANFVKDRVSASFSESGLDPEIWGPDLTGPIAGDDAETRMTNATNRAVQINADVLVYGIMKKINNQWSFTPEFYINSKNYQKNAPEILGNNEFGKALQVAIPFKRSDVATGGNPELSARSQALGLLTIGLAYYSFDRYDKALEYFDKAIAVPDWLDINGTGKEVAYVLRGNARSRLDSQKLDFSDIDLARQDYQKAWDITRQTYGRALLGLGSVAYVQALKDPVKMTPESIDQDKLAEAEAIFKQALALPDQPLEYHIEPKAYFALGQIDQVRGGTLKEPGRLDQAVNDYKQVTLAYDNASEEEKTNLQDLASFAYARMGLLYANDLKDLEGATNWYQKALDIASPYYKAVYTGSLGVIYFQYGVDAADLAVQSQKDSDRANARARFTKARDLLQSAIDQARALTNQDLINQYQELYDQLIANYSNYLG